MADEFSHIPPNSEKYMQVLLKYLKTQREDELYSALRNASCNIQSNYSYSHKRWNAYSAFIYFYIPIDDFSTINFSEDSKTRLIECCDRIMPKDVGYDVVGIEISPSVEESFSTNTLQEDLVKISEDLSDVINPVLPEDIFEKGKQMAEVYLYLYVIENFMRLFIEKVGLEKNGSDYFNNFAVPRKIRDTIEGRKKTEEKNKWISIRGSSDLFYLDFVELGVIINNNWDLFCKFFPDSSWISSKLDDLYRIRNLVAHNSYVSNHERDVLRVTFNSIVLQLK